MFIVISSGCVLNINRINAIPSFAAASGLFPFILANPIL